MTRGEAEKLLGGYATDTLTEAERRVLFEVALTDQALFDALADEEVLRELLADPAVRRRLLAALAPRVVPLWRRPGVLGVAAGLLVAGLAGLAVLHGPGEASAPRTEAPVPAPKAEEAIPVTKAPEPVLSKPRATPAPKIAPPARVEEAPVSLPAADRSVEAPAVGNLEKKRAEERLKAEEAAKARALEDRAPVGAAAVVEVVPSLRAAPAQAPSAPAAGALPAAVAEAAPEPAWSAATRADGTLRVTVLALPGRPVLLLRRGTPGVTVVKPMAVGREGARIRWQMDLRPLPGEALDLYILNGPVVDPAKLPAEGPVEGFRTRIPIPEKKAPAP